MNLSFVERVEIAIAKHWPDLYKVQEVTGANSREVHRVLAAMDDGPPKPEVTPSMKRAHTEYERLRSGGMRIAEMPEWVQVGQREYDRSFRAASRASRASADAATTRSDAEAGRPGIPTQRATPDREQVSA